MHSRDELITRAINRLEAAVIALPETLELKPIEAPVPVDPVRVVAAPMPHKVVHVPPSSKFLGFLHARRRYVVKPRVAKYAR